MDTLVCGELFGCTSGLRTHMLYVRKVFHLQIPLMDKNAWKGRYSVNNIRLAYREPLSDMISSAMMLTMGRNCYISAQTIRKSSIPTFLSAVLEASRTTTARVHNTHVNKARVMPRVCSPWLSVPGATPAGH
jgi:hypothetical protein